MRAFLVPHSHNEYLIFSRAGRAFASGGQIYSMQWDPFRYSPTIAATIAPLTIFSDSIGGVIWRFLATGILAAGLLLFTSTSWPRLLRGRDQASFILLVLPLSMGNIADGQSNPIVLGFLLIAVASAAVNRWNLAAATAAAAALFKVYPLAAGLLLCLLYPRALVWRLAAALVIGLALPFLFQNPHYVSSQYAAWFQSFSSDIRWELAPVFSYRDLHLLLALAHLRVTHNFYIALQLLAAAGIAIICVAASRAGWSRARLSILVLELGTAWMVLLGAATDGTTSMLLAPAAVCEIIETHVERTPLWLRGCLITSYVLLLDTSLIGELVQTLSPVPYFAVKPLGALLLALSFLVIELRRFGVSAEPPVFQQQKTA